MTRKHLLFVDDDQSILNTLHRTLRNIPYQKHFATSAEEGLEILKKYPIGIVVSDQHMPGMNGVEFLQEIRKDYPGVVRVILSAYADKRGLGVTQSKSHMHYIIQKPWRNEELIFLLKETMKNLSTDKDWIEAD